MVRAAAGEYEAFRALVSTRLRAARGERLQSDFAGRVDSPQQTVSKYELSEIPRSWLFLQRLCDNEGIDLNELLTMKKIRRRNGDS